jgi:hypothetical protein
MEFEASDLLDAIATGIKSVLPRTMELTGERGEDPRPEYLTTASVCFSLCDFARDRGLQGVLRIRCEEKTSDVWGKGFVRWILDRLRSGMKPGKLTDFRDGNVDITLLSGHGFESPFAVIENKGLLHFTAEGQLYAGSRSEVIKDLKRNAAFVSGMAAAGGVQYSAFTFYLRDRVSVTRQDGDAVKARMRRYFQGLLEELGLGVGLRTHVRIEDFDDDLYESPEDALAPEDSGAPASDMYPAWSLLYGVISIYRAGTVVLDVRKLYEETELAL